MVGASGLIITAFVNKAMLFYIVTALIGFGCGAMCSPSLSFLAEQCMPEKRGLFYIKPPIPNPAKIVPAIVIVKDLAFIKYKIVYEATEKYHIIAKHASTVVVITFLYINKSLMRPVN